MPQQTKASKTPDEMLQMKLGGRSYRDIGAAAGISGQRVQQILSPPKAIARMVKDRTNSLCEGCGVFVQHGHIHHEGSVGADDYQNMENLRYLCMPCHRHAHPGIRSFRAREAIPLQDERPTLRQLRESLARTQKEVAAATGISEAHYNKIERGRHMPRARAIRNMAAYFGITAREIRDIIASQVA